LAGLLFIRDLWLVASLGSAVKKADHATQVAPTWRQVAEYGGSSKGGFTVEAVKASIAFDGLGS
jgi:hypothetical protein